MSFSKFGKISDILRIHFSVWPSYFSPSGFLVTYMLDFFFFCHGHTQISRFWSYFCPIHFLFVFRLGNFSCYIPKLRIFSSALSILLLNLPSELFWFINFSFEISICIFFISSIHLLRLSCSFAPSFCNCSLKHLYDNCFKILSDYSNI